MSSCIMQKAEVVVLFDLLCDAAIPISIKDLPKVSEFEHARITKAFVDGRLIDNAIDNIRFDKGFEPFLLPILKSEKVMLFNYGLNGKCLFNATLYFSKCGAAAIFDTDADEVRFITIDSFDDLLLFIPKIPVYKHFTENDVIHFSYIIFDENSTTVHCAKINSKKNIAAFAEEKKSVSAEPVKTEFETDMAEYEKLFRGRLRGVYDVVGC